MQDPTRALIKRDAALATMSLLQQQQLERRVLKRSANTNRSNVCEKVNVITIIVTAQYDKSLRGN